MKTISGENNIKVRNAEMQMLPRMYEMSSREHEIFYELRGT